MLDAFDQFTRWRCPKCGAGGFDSWNKAMFDGVSHDPDALPNPWVLSDCCHVCAWSAVVSYTTPDAAPRAIFAPSRCWFDSEEELAACREIVDGTDGHALLPSLVRDADWSRGCMAAKGQLQ
ncbi:MAG: hypothetical protein WBL20_08070 [Sphingobium sp.]|uniref:hypothetical protein n=1 Tax=Sphingobium sp. TaxID=1912891 RepID=UPI003BAEC8F4